MQDRICTITKKSTDIENLKDHLRGNHVFGLVGLSIRYIFLMYSRRDRITQLTSWLKVSAFVLRLPNRKPTEPIQLNLPF